VLSREGLDRFRQDHSYRYPRSQFQEVHSASHDADFRGLCWRNLLNQVFRSWLKNQNCHSRSYRDE
jgi:hypothetical protein